MTVFFKEFVEVCKNDLLIKNIFEHHTYPSLGKTDAWEKVCKKSKNVKEDKVSINNFIKKFFRVKLFDKNPGVLTGYYEPSIKVSLDTNNFYKIPILKKNKKFLNKTRRFIEKNYRKEDVLLWTDNKIDFFFLQIQGSGIGILPDGKKIRLSFSGSNKLNYTSIGKHLIRKGALKKNVSMFSIKNWLNTNPEKINDVLNINQRYVFFTLDELKNEYARGAMNIPLQPYTSVAIDIKKYPLGIPFILEIEEENRLFPVIAHDTGSAIKGFNRADIFTGSSTQSEIIAGKLKKKIYLFTLLPYIENHD